MTGLGRFALKRVLTAVPVLLGVTLVSSLLIHLVPGDPARTLLGLKATAAQVAHLDRQLGVDKPLPVQYVDFLKHVVTGSFGTSILSGRSVGSLILQRLPVTVWLLAYALLLSVVLAVPLAMLAASRPGAIRDHSVRGVSILALGVPQFVVGILLIQLLAVDHHVFPPSGFGTGVAGHIKSMFLPSLSLALGGVPLIVRSLRAEMLKVTEADHVTIARAKGLPERAVRIRHILRNALSPSVAVLTVGLAGAVGATVIVEDVFAVPGLGDLLINSISGRDFPVVQGVVVIMAVMVLAITAVGDVLQGILDPRVKLT